MSIYLATFVTAGLVLQQWVQWAALGSVVTATVATIRIWEHGRWDLGLFVPPAIAVRELLLGIGFAAAIIAACDGLILLMTDVRQSWAGGFPVRDLLIVFVPAALHEELAFRGYVYQKVRQWSRPVAMTLSSAVFALLHSGNVAVSALAIANIFVAGILLALAYERFRRLWFPIGVHFAWNLVSGPALGFPVSGFVPKESLLRVSGSGSALLTGGPFGLEGSLCMTLVEILGIVVLLRSSKFELRSRTFRGEGSRQ